MFEKLKAPSTRAETIFSSPFSSASFQEFLRKNIAKTSHRNAAVHIQGLYTALVLHQKKKKTDSEYAY